MDLRNRIRLYGNVGQAPELRFNNTGDGAPVTSFRLAVDEPRGESETPKSQWFTVELWGRNAERAAELVTKGAFVTVEGRLKVDEWSDRDGRARYTLVVANADFLVHKEGNGNGRGEHSPPA